MTNKTFKEVLDEAVYNKLHSKIDDHVKKTSPDHPDHKGYVNQLHAYARKTKRSDPAEVEKWYHNQDYDKKNKDTNP